LIPLVIALAAIRKVKHALRGVMVALFVCLSGFLLLVQYRPETGPVLSLNAVLFTVYFGCCIHFWYAYRRSTAGSIITTFGFLAWAAVFVVGPITCFKYRVLHVEAE